MQLGLTKHKELPDVPTLDAFVTAAADRQVLELIFSRQAMGRPLVAPPGIHPQVGEALRTALNQKLVGYWLSIQAAIPHLRQDGSITLLSGAASRTTSR